MEIVEVKNYKLLKVLSIIFLTVMIGLFIFDLILYFTVIIDMIEFDPSGDSLDSLGIGIGLVLLIIFSLIFLGVSIPSLICSIVATKSKLRFGKICLYINLGIYIVSVILLIIMIIVSNTYNVPVSVG